MEGFAIFKFKVVTLVLRRIKLKFCIEITDNVAGNSSGQVLY